MILYQGGLVSKRPVDWPRILLAIIATYRSLQQSVQAYIKGCNVCISSIVRAQALRRPPVVAVAALPTRREKDWSVNFVAGLPFPPIGKASAMICCSSSIDSRR